MAKLISYELQTFNNGQWVIDSIFDDRELAAFEAKRASESKRYSAVRLVQEEFDETTNETQNRVVFRSSAVDGENKKSEEQRKAPSRYAAAPKERPAAAPKAPAKSRDNSIVLILVMGAILMGGLLALIGLQYLSQLV